MVGQILLTCKEQEGTIKSYNDLNDDKGVTRNGGWGLDNVGLVNHVVAVDGVWSAVWIDLMIGLCRHSKSPILRDLSTIYVELAGGTPLLVQVFFSVSLSVRC